MSRWFRFYDGALDDPKVQGLRPYLFKFWVNLLCVASKNDGKLPVADLAFLMRGDQESIDRAMEELSMLGLIDKTPDDVTPHNWDKRQFKSDVSTERVKRHRERGCNVSETVTETPPDNRTEQNTEKKESRRKAPRRISYPPRYQVFWEGYPADPLMSKSEGFTEWQKLSAEDQEAAIAALPAFKAATAKLGPDHRVIHACRFLSKRRWEGFAEASAKAQAATEAASTRVYVRYGTDQGDAWEASYRLNGRVPPRDSAGGWWFDSEYPSPSNVQRETSEQAA